MKNIKLYVLPLLILLISVTACKDEFLDVAPKQSLSSNELSSLAGIEGSLISSYSMLLGRDGGFYSDVSNWLWGSIRGGEANKGTDPGDQSVANPVVAYSVPTNNGPVLEKYRACYEGIARANATLGLIAVAQEGVPADDLARITAEARFLRGFYYFELKKNYNNTPYVDETWDEQSPVTNTLDLYVPIEADLKHAYDNLPEMMSDKGRANKWAAGALYAKVLLFQGKSGDALAIFNKVIDSGVTADGTPYGLLDNYADAFRSLSDNSKESVFASQAAAGTGTILNANPAMVLNFPNGGGPGGCCGFFPPSFDMVNAFRTDVDGFPLVDGSYNDAGNAVANDMGIAAADPFTPDGGNLDPRIDHSVGRRGIPYLDWGDHPGQAWIRNQPNAGPYAPKKFIYYQAGAGVENDASSWTPGYTAVNYNIIRYADVLLMTAEAEIESNGDLDRAKDLINMLRQRAMDSPLQNAGGTDAANYVIGLYTSFANQEEARQALRFERRMELSGEGHRMYDLNRWGIAAATLNPFIAHEDAFLGGGPYQGASFDAGKDEFLPIPQTEIDLLGADVLKQNPGY
ncbi:MAG: RagB/SusD family nutrient uptake outer membrane protein [Saprospiraceae bacterium]